MVLKFYNPEIEMVKKLNFFSPKASLSSKDNSFLFSPTRKKKTDSLTDRNLNFYFFNKYSSFYFISQTENP